MSSPASRSSASPATGRRLLYHRHSGYPGGISTTIFEDANPILVARSKGGHGCFRRAAGYKMLKKLALRRRRTPAAAQQPKTLTSDPMIGNYYYGTGRRKSAVARVFLKKGTGTSSSTKPADEFFSRDRGHGDPPAPEAHQPRATFDIMINVEGVANWSGRRRAPRHARADRLRRGAQAHALCRARHARRAKSAQEGWTPQGP